MSAFEDAMLDFDINFLPPSSIANKQRSDKYSTPLQIMKQKVIGIDMLVKKNYAIRQSLDAKEVMLITLKQECKQSCIEYQEISKKSEKLEKDLHALQKQYAELDSKCTLAQNQCEGMKSHANQLQLLIKENELVIEALKIEKHLEKNYSGDYEKNLSSKQKEIEVLVSHIKSLAKDNALGKKKLRKRHKLLLQKYNNLKSITFEDDSSSDSGNDQPDFSDDSIPSPFSTPPGNSAGDKLDHDVFQPNKIENCLKTDLRRHNEENESDFSNEVVSVDTGRGSSLTFSDGEKCFNSPDYFINDSPVTKEIGQANEKPVLVDSGTSPIRSHDVVDMANSRIFSDEVLHSHEADSNNLEYIITDFPLSNEIVTIKEKRKLIDIGTSPIKDLEKVNIATSPLFFEEYVDRNVSESLSASVDTNFQTSNVSDKYQSNINIRNSPCRPMKDETVTDIKEKHTTMVNLASHCEVEISEKSTEERKCLERNNSKNLMDENSNDGEIEMILNTMRMTQRLITPIPESPVKIRNNKSNKVDQEILILREDVTILQSSMSQVLKSLTDIKSMIQNDRLNMDNSSVELPIASSDNTEIFDDSSQETIFINVNDDNGNNRTEESEITNCSSSNILTNVVSQIIESPAINKSIEKDFKKVSVTDVANGTNNDSRKPITFEEEYLSSDDESDMIINDGVDHTLLDITTDCSKTKRIKKKKISKLDKFKKKILPKSKISKNVPLPKLRSKPIVVIKKINEMDVNAILNNKTAYENAAKVMAEMKSKENDLLSQNEKHTSRMTKKTCDGPKDHVNDNDCLEEQQRSSRNEEDNPENYNKGKTNNHQCDKHLESKEEDIAPITTRTRSGKLSSNYCVSTTQISAKETSKLEEKRKRLKRRAKDNPSVGSKRVLRSSSIRETLVDLDTINKVVSCDSTNEDFGSPKRRNHKISNSMNDNLNTSDDVINDTNTPNKINKLKLSNTEHIEQNNKVTNSPKRNQNKILSDSENEEINTSDNIIQLSNRTNKIQVHKLTNLVNAIEECNKSTEVTNIDPIASRISHPKQSILCRMLEIYGRSGSKSSNKKVPDNITKSISERLEKGIALINELPAGKVKPAMNKLFEEVQSWNIRHFMLGFMIYLKNPDRKSELFNKVNSPPAPPMTKAEQVLLYIVRQMEIQTPNTVNVILTHIEYSLFQLNRTPEFDIIESLSHFYALLCRYFGLKSRLRLFILDAMYCVQFKVVPLIKQCLDVWMHILPLAHMGIAKSPLVTCLVYLLHFYKCEDRFNRVQEIRNILSRKYFYEITDWNETKILDMFKNAIKEVRDIPIEKKMLRTALIVLGKRHGAKWCHKNIVKSMLMPMIESQDTSMNIKQFCVQLLGALLKPFPTEMKVHFEITVNLLNDMLQQDPPDAMKEAIFTSLIYINQHNPNLVIRSLLSWMPKRVSPEFEQFLRDYVRGKPLHVWKKILSKITM